MTIRDLTEQFTIQGAFQIKKWNDEEEMYEMLSDGSMFEDEYIDIEEEILDMKIKYMYAIPMQTGLAAYLVIEVE